jgi:hypothetical protein
MIVKKKNITHPLKPNYTGPTKGWFIFIHHDTILEYSGDILDRVAYVRTDKPAHEQAARTEALQFVNPKFITTQLDPARRAYATARHAYDTAKQAYATAKQAYAAARHAYETAGHAYHDTRHAYGTAWQACITAKQAYDTAGHAYHDARHAYGSTAWLIRTFPKTDWKKLWNEKARTLLYT